MSESQHAGLHNIPKFCKSSHVFQQNISYKNEHHQVVNCRRNKGVCSVSVPLPLCFGMLSHGTVLNMYTAAVWYTAVIGKRCIIDINSVKALTQTKKSGEYELNKLQE